jgi:hypothetical protein
LDEVKNPFLAKEQRTAKRKSQRKSLLKIFFSAILASSREMLFAPQQTPVSRQGAKIAKRKTTTKKSS